jgi:hypothetical protein
MFALARDDILAAFSFAHASWWPAKVLRHCLVASVGGDFGRLGNRKPAEVSRRVLRRPRPRAGSARE